ncbi:hypothetical protein [Streptomyces ziwulingensis]
MAATGVVGDAACSMSAVGRPDPGLVPPLDRIGIGQSDGYTCLVF